MSNKQVLNNLTDSEIQLLYLIRGLKPFSKLQISCPKRGELRWELSTVDVGTVSIDIILNTDL